MTEKNFEATEEEAAQQLRAERRKRYLDRALGAAVGSVVTMYLLALDGFAQPVLHPFKLLIAFVGGHVRTALFSLF
jgi:hypothetical protein